MGKRKLTVLSLLGLLVAAQFVPVEAPVYGGSEDVDLSLPDPLSLAIRQSCFDCHSESRSLPWYGRIAPMSWWMSQEVRRGQNTLNFSRWEDYSSRQKQLIWQRSLLRVQAKVMPPKAYHLAHPRFGAPEVAALKEHLQTLSESPLQSWRPEELLAWPTSPWAGGGVTGVEQGVPGTLETPLLLEGGLLLIDGDFFLPEGLSGQGAILVTGRLEVDKLKTQQEAITLVGLQGVSLRAVRDCQLTGTVLSNAEIEKQNVRIVPQPNSRLTFSEVQERRAEFCREDGELGEFAERAMIVRHKDGQFVFWEPEFQRVERASSLEQALNVVATMMTYDESTSVKDWQLKYKEGWQRLLEGLPTEGAPGVLQLQLTPES